MSASKTLSTNKGETNWAIYKPVSWMSIHSYLYTGTHMEPSTRLPNLVMPPLPESEERKLS